RSQAAPPHRPQPPGAIITERPRRSPTRTAGPRAAPSLRAPAARRMGAHRRPGTHGSWRDTAPAAQKNDDTLQKNVPSPLKERPTQERSVTQEEKLPTKPTPVKGKRICSDQERILKARKLREMLKEELKKERLKQLKHRPPVIEGRSPPDRSKMTMRDLIYYLPENNPMKSSLAEEKRTEKNSALDEEEEAENGEESQDGPLLVPRVKVAEDGSIILDEESLTVEVLRTKGPCVVEENDPIFERGSTTTYSSFRKSFYTKPWSNKGQCIFECIMLKSQLYKKMLILFQHLSS
uniref:BDP1 factor n=1 Tax=Nothoprocta perdicaria TaxID=30464 RepID=A0A8C7A502_NOTPE